MRFNIQDKSLWHLWFAWHPVETENKWIWLEMVLRRWNLLTNFRIIHPEDLGDYDGGYEYRELK